MAKENFDRDAPPLDAVQPRKRENCVEGVNSGMLKRLNSTDGSPIPSHDGKSPGYVRSRKP